MAKKWIYFFGEGKATQKALLGGKGANLSEMTRIGFPVPPGFTISTEACNYYSKNRKYPTGLDKEILKNMRKMEEKMGREFGSTTNPLLVSVRSGAKFSMPGMMDTILNLGLNKETTQIVAKQTKNPKFAWDSYRRFIQMFSDVVLGIPVKRFELVLENARKRQGVKLDYQLKPEMLKKVAEKYLQIVKNELGREFPQDPYKQLNMAIQAVFRSWNNERAFAYRRINNIPDDLGTAVNVQSMVFGNWNKKSGTGVAFTRNPSTGENKFYGEYLMNAQGEDVVAGIRTPNPVSHLREDMPKAYRELLQIRKKLEEHYREMQDVEFTIQEGKLYMLQTRNGKRTAKAAVKIAVDMVKEKLIDTKTAVQRITPSSLDQMLHKTVDPKAKKKILAKGLPASPGAAVGTICFDAKDAKDLGAKGKKVVLCRTETSPEDIEGMHAAVGILTSRGGMTSHAAVVARGMGKCCVAGCEKATIDEHAKTISVSGYKLKEGDTITLNGSTGEVILGACPLVEPSFKGEFQTLMDWAKKFKKLKVRTNADTPNDCKTALKFGAEGIGLTRTEHMFFAPERIKVVREMIIATNYEERMKAIKKLLPMQRTDFKGILRAMNGNPVTIRLLDPPLHEFLPNEKEAIVKIAHELGVSTTKVKKKIASLKEINPMLGHRGCRLGIVYPEITEMQIQAIIEAACDLQKQKIKVNPEIMIPLVGNVKELKNQKEIVKRVAKEVMKKKKVKKLNYKIGTMIEIPRAALTADELATEAEFFSFGTNDLTQMALGFSRDDSASFLPHYLEKGILKKDPFQTIDFDGVGQLIKTAIRKGKSTKKNIHYGICGEHGGDPESVEFCHKNGFYYVSCSPFRVPIAILAAAHAALKYKR